MPGKPPRKNRYFDAVDVVPQYDDVYDSAEFSLTTGNTNYNVKTNESTSFVSVPRAHSIIIRTDQTITVRFNSISNSAITISRGEGSLTITRDIGLEITNIYVTNASGSTAAIKIFLVP